MSDEAATTPVTHWLAAVCDPTRPGSLGKNVWATPGGGSAATNGYLLVLLDEAVPGAEPIGETDLNRLRSVVPDALMGRLTSAERLRDWCGPEPAEPQKEPCWRCQGKGKITCRNCDGTGEWQCECCDSVLECEDCDADCFEECEECDGGFVVPLAGPDVGLILGRHIDRHRLRLPVTHLSGPCAASVSKDALVLKGEGWLVMLMSMSGPVPDNAPEFNAWEEA